MEPILMKIYESYAGEDRDMLLRAYDFAGRAHLNQKRASGEPYFIHPCAVAEILVELGLDAETIAGALLHDVIEDTPVTAEDIRREFGEEVLTLVSGVTKLDRFVFKSREEEEAENFRKIFIAMAKDIRVIIIKLADRLHNMRSLNFLSAERQQKMARETLDIYAPIAGRLGISQIKCELEDLCLKYIDPAAFEFLVENIHQKLEERNRFVDFVVGEINSILMESNISGEVFGRPKHFYSIYKKMTTKNKSLEQIYDLTAVRVIVGNVDECYEVFGKIHKKWKPVPGRIKDYIATPKPNLYQSLHTTVVTNFGQPFEIQIRTEEMHRTAEYGIAAHWKYKENRTTTETTLDQRIAWIREMMEIQGGLKDSKEFMDTVKGELYSTELLVFTPQSKVISLPSGATPVDFAYAIHSEVGNRCTGAKVNGKIVPLDSTLELGDVVEIITSPNSKGPSRDWLKFIKSSSARAKIKTFFKKSMQEDNIRLGRSMLEDAAKRKGTSLTELLTPESFRKVSERFSFDTQDEMFSAIGYGSISVNQVFFKLVDYFRKEAPVPILQPFKEKNAKGAVTIKGMSGLLVSFAGCCSPVPGDDIIGFVTRGRGIVVHRRDCPNLKNAEADRLQPAEWVRQAAGESRFKAGLVVTAEEQGAALAAISSVLAEMKLSLTSINGRYDKSGDAIVDVTVSLLSKQDIEVLVTKLSARDKIISVRRLTN